MKLIDAIQTVIDDVADSVLQQPTDQEALDYARNELTDTDLQEWAQRDDGTRPAELIEAYHMVRAFD